MWNVHKSRQNRSRHRMSVLLKFIQWSDIQGEGLPAPVWIERFVVPAWGAEICSDWISSSVWGREERKEINTKQHAGSHPDSLRHSCSHNLRCMWDTNARMTENGDSSCLRSAASLAVALVAYVPRMANPFKQAHAYGRSTRTCLSPGNCFAHITDVEESLGYLIQ